MSETESPKKMIILGWYVGMGALIQSTVNSIWLARKLGFQPFIRWGYSCLYSPGNGEDAYPRYFCPPPALSQLPSSEPLNISFSEVFRDKTRGLSISEIDREAPKIDKDTTHWWRREQRDELLRSETAVIYQYLNSDLAWEMAHGLGIPVRWSEFDQERNLIFSEFFKPQMWLQERADQFWNERIGNGKKALGMHVRGSDKVSEKAVPGISRYLRAFETENPNQGFDSVFLATDSSRAEQTIRHDLKEKCPVVCQEYERTDGITGLHLKNGGAFQNGVDMIVDIELLSRCPAIVAFPGSQIYWWLERKAYSQKMKLVPVKPGIYDWFNAGAKVWRLRGNRDFIRLLKEFKKSLSEKAAGS